MPVDWSKYPDNWDEIANQVKTRAGWECEQCHMPHMGDGTMGSCLTVHHPGRDPENKAAELVALCARCHLAADRRLRREIRERDQLKLFTHDDKEH